MDGSRVGRRGGAAAGWILSSSIEGTCLIILCIPRAQNGAGSQRTHWKPWAWFPVSVGWEGQRKRNKGDVDGCQQRRGGLDKQRRKRDGRGLLPQASNRTDTECENTPRQRARPDGAIGARRPPTPCKLDSEGSRHLSLSQ